MFVHGLYFVIRTKIPRFIQSDTDNKSSRSQEENGSFEVSQ